MNVLFVTQGIETLPSPRYRVYQLLPGLRASGITATILPRRDVWRARPADVDVIFVQKGILPGLTSFWEERFARRKPVVFDLDDAIWLPRRGGNPILRTLHRESTVQRALHCATAVIVGNSFLADYARQCNPNVTIIPSAIDLAAYPKLQTPNPKSQIGWIGSRTTLPYLKPLGPVFQKLNVKPLVVAAGDPGVLGFPVEFRTWRLDREQADLADIGIGVAPLPDTPWERGKCGVKLLQYMARGIPVVASPVGVHNDIVQDGVNGFLARDDREWNDRLRQLLGDAALRQRFGAAGRGTVARRYSLATAVQSVADLLQTMTR